MGSRPAWTRWQGTAPDASEGASLPMRLGARALRVWSDGRASGRRGRKDGGCGEGGWRAWGGGRGGGGTRRSSMLRGDSGQEATRRQYKEQLHRGDEEYKERRRRGGVCEGDLGAHHRRLHSRCGVQTPALPTLPPPLLPPPSPVRRHYLSHFILRLRHLQLRLCGRRPSLYLP